MIRPVPIKLLRAISERAARAGIPKDHALARRAKGAALNAYALHSASYADALAAAHAVLGGIPLPMPTPGGAA